MLHFNQNMEAPKEPILAVLKEPMNPFERVIKIFYSPTSAFKDVKRSSNWWLPIILIAVFGYGLFFAIQTQITWRTVIDNQMKVAPAAQVEQLDKLAPEARERQLNLSANVTKWIFIVMPALTAINFLFFGLLYWVTLNIGFGARAKYGQVVAVIAFASLPMLIKFALGVLAIYSNPTPESFSISNFAPTNVAFAMNAEETQKALYALLSSLDAITLWSTFLTGLGLSVVCGVKKSVGQITAWAWFAVVTLLVVGVAALKG